MPQDVRTELHYLKPDPKWDIEKPYTLFADVSNIAGASPTNIIKQAAKDVLVHDVRSNPEVLSLQNDGFEVVPLALECKPEDFLDENWVQSVYYPFACEMVKKKTGAREVRAYQHKVRTSPVASLSSLH